MADKRPARASIIAVGAAILLASVLLAAAPGALRADIYRWVDDRGVVHFSNAPTDTRFRLYLKETGLTGKQFVKKYDKSIRRQANTYGVDPNLVKAVIKAESNYDHTAVSKKGAQGLMQLMPDTSRRLKVKNPFNPDENIAGGVRLLGKLLERFDNNLTLAVAAYNAGPRAVEKYRDVPPYKETRDFVVKVLKYYRDLHQSGSK